MSHESVRRWCACVGALLVVLAAPVGAAADDSKVDVAGGYSFLRLIPSDGDSTNLPAGWFAAVGGQVSGPFGLVGKVSGNYKTEKIGSLEVKEKVHSFLAGPRFMSPSGPARAFGQVLFGGSNFDASGGGFSSSETDFTIEPGVGVDVSGTSAVGIRLGVNFLLIRTKGDSSSKSSWEKAVQAVVGIVFHP